MNRKSALLVAVAALFVAGCTLGLPKGRPVKLPAAAPAPERTPIYKLAGWTIARASLHNHTVYSDGRYEPEDLLELAHRQGIAILAYNDHREGKICVGKALCIQAGGVEQVGYEAYFRRLEPIQARARELGMIATRGVEVSSPWFYNTGKYPNLVLNDQYKHFTVYGVKDPKILAEMPARRNLETTKPETVPGDTPIQNWLNFLDEHGAIVNAAHVEEGQDEWWGGIHVLTIPPIYNLHLQRLNGFAALPSAWHDRTAGPGGLWDTDLSEYLLGLRDRPLWTMGDADFHGPGGSLANATTLFYMKEFTEDEVYRCMREGRMVALMGDSFQDVYVTEWSVSAGAAAPADPIMLGADVKIKGVPVIRFALSREFGDLRARLIRNGVVVKEVAGGRLEFADEEQAKKMEPAFYRVEVVGPALPSVKRQNYPTDRASELFVNPIFVRFGR